MMITKTRFRGVWQTESEIKKFRVKCNSHICSETSTVNIIQVVFHKKNLELFQVAVELNSNT